MGIQGTGLKNSNPQLRYLMIFFGGLIAFGVAFYRRHQTIKQTDYVDFPMQQTTVSKGELRSKNFQIDVEDVSPTAK